MADLPDLVESSVLAGHLSLADVFRFGEEPPRLERVVVPKSKLGVYSFDFTVLNHWVGAGGPWTFDIEVVDVHLITLFGVDPPKPQRFQSVHTFPEARPDAITAVPVSIIIRTYGSVSISVSCDGETLRTYGLPVLPG